MASWKICFFLLYNKYIECFDKDVFDDLVNYIIISGYDDNGKKLEIW